MIRATDKGFSLTFGNGWRVDVTIDPALGNVVGKTGPTSRIAVWDPIDKAYVFADDPQSLDDGHILYGASANRVTEVLALVAEQDRAFPK